MKIIFIWLQTQLSLFPWLAGSDGMSRNFLLISVLIKADGSLSLDPQHYPIDYDWMLFSYYCSLGSSYEMHILLLSKTWGYWETEEYCFKFYTPQSIEICTPRLWKSYNFNSFYDDKVILKLNYHCQLSEAGLW